jgi:hypoxanthine-guanine phosphoribosyltransferase
MNKERKKEGGGGGFLGESYVFGFGLDLDLEFTHIPYIVDVLYI